MKLHFTKMNGAGNDFVMVDNRDGALALSREQIARICDRHRGVGADGLLAVEPPQTKDADFRMRYYNSDGGEAEMCGNGARCFARFVARLLGKPVAAVSFETIAGGIRAELVGALVRLGMSTPRDLRLDLSLTLLGREWPVRFLDTGVPHAVVALGSEAELEAFEVHATGAALRYHEAFAPRGTNANFIAPSAGGTLAIRTYERGVEGETLACGTGVTASALVHHLLTGAASPVSVRVRGGDVLVVGFEKDAAGAFQNVTLTGPADFVFEGSLDLP